MPDRYVVVDGSNIATEGRSIPSLAQLDEAVRAFMAERPNDQVIVVVDASFGYRIDESERSEYEQAEAAGEIVSPPAGAVGRGDGFLLRIADRTNATVLSNDSFQEFHGEYPWLFDAGRLIGGKPVPGVGWIFTLRTPVRGPRSREATRAADKAKKAALKRAAVAEGPVAQAIAEATAEAIDPKQDGEDAEPAKVLRRARRRRSKPAGAVNDPLPFIEFIAEHPLGTEVEGEVEGFTSHGAFVRAGAARCYVPLVALGEPPPRSAKEVLTKGETRTFVVQALDPPRRGIELALPGLARVAGVPTEETVEADMGVGQRRRPDAPRADVAAEPVPAAAEGAEVGAAPAKRARRTRKTAAPVPEPETVPVVAAPSPDAEPEPVAEPVVAVEAPPPAKARRTRKKQTVPATAGTEDGQAAAAQPEPTPTPGPGPATGPPTSGRRTRRRAQEAAPDVPVEGDAAPAKRARRRAKAAEPSEVAPSEEIPPAPPVEPAAATSPPRRRSRRPTPEEAPPAAEDETTVAAPAKSPGRTRRRTAHEPQEGGEQTSEPARSSAGPRRSPARAAARLAAPRMPVPEEESEQAPPPKRSRARRAAPIGEPEPPVEPVKKKATRTRSAAKKVREPEPEPDGEGSAPGRRRRARS